MIFTTVCGSIQINEKTLVNEKGTQQFFLQFSVLINLTDWFVSVQFIYTDRFINIIWYRRFSFSFSLLNNYIVGICINKFHHFIRIPLIREESLHLSSFFVVGMSWVCAHSYAYGSLRVVKFTVDIAIWLDFLADTKSRIEPLFLFWKYVVIPRSSRPSQKNYFRLEHSITLLKRKKPTLFIESTKSWVFSVCWRK